MDILHTLSTVAQCEQYRVDAEFYRFTLWGPNYGGAIVRIHRFQTLTVALDALARYGGGTIILFPPALEAD